MEKKGMIGNLIGAFVAILVGVSLLPTISRQVKEIDTTNLPSYGATILNLTPLFFALGILGIGVATAYSGLKNAGLGKEDSQQEQMGGDRHKRLGPSERKSSVGCRLPAETESHMPADFKSEIKLETHGEDYFK